MNEVSENATAGFRFELAEPPNAVPVYDGSKEVGVLDCFRVERSWSQFRCSNCDEMQPDGSGLVWVPDSARIFDPKWAVEELARTNAYNGNGSGWCVSCARKIGQETDTGVPKKGELPLEALEEPNNAVPSKNDNPELTAYAVFLSLLVTLFIVAPSYLFGAIDFVQAWIAASHAFAVGMIIAVLRPELTSSVKRAFQTRS